MSGSVAESRLTGGCVCVSGMARDATPETCKTLIALGADVAHKAQGKVRETRALRVDLEGCEG